MELHLGRLSHRAGDFNKEISGKTKVRRHGEGTRRGPLMIYRGFITANSPRTAAADAEEKTSSGGKEERGRERERENRAPRPRLLIFYASHLMTSVREGPFEPGSERPVGRRRAAFSGTLFSLFVPWNVLTLKRGSRSARDVSDRRFNSGIASRMFSEQRRRTRILNAR